MIDASDVTEFAVRLKVTPNPIIEEAWRGEWSQKVAEEMRRTAPIDTGTLRASIHVTDTGAEASAPYAAFVEYGTSDTPPQPFAGPTVTKLIKPAAIDAGNRMIRSI